MIAREVDFPPVWLAGFAATGGILARIYPVSVPHADVIGALLVILALGLMAGAILQMLWSRTTVIPRRDPARMLTSGLFRFSRNPIYLADATLLAGLYIYWGALFALPLVVAFMMLISKRFIRGEEDRLARQFGAEFDAYKNQTRRWI